MFPGHETLYAGTASSHMHASSNEHGLMTSCFSGSWDFGPGEMLFCTLPYLRIQMARVRPWSGIVGPVSPIGLLRQSQGRQPLAVAPTRDRTTRVTEIYDAKVHHGRNVSDVLDKVEHHVKCGCERIATVGDMYLRANQPSSSSLLVGAGSGAPGFVSEMGSLT